MNLLNTVIYIAAKAPIVVLSKFKIFLKNRLRGWNVSVKFFGKVIWCKQF